ncbi:MAG: efflux RND transporter permease subunit [Alphaproteobacteria bacterium]
MFWFLVNFSLRRKAMVLLAALALVVYGTYTAAKMPIDLLPELHQPMVTVVTECNGFAAEEVEQLVAQPIEAMLNGIPGVTRVRSSIGAGFDVTYVEFSWGTDIYRNRQLVSERLALALPNLPPKIEPQIAPMSSVMGLVMSVAVTSDTLDPMALREITDWVVRPRLMAIPGVSQVYMAGGDVRQFQFTPDTIAMQRLDISPDKVAAALDSFGSNTSGGFADISDREYIIRNVGRTKNLEDMASIVVDFREGKPVLLSQIGTVSYTPRAKRGDAGYNGRPAVLMAVLKHPTQNTVQLADKVEATLSELQKVMPAGVQVNQIAYTQATLIKDSIENVRDVLIDAIVIVAIVLMAFLMNVRTTAVSLTSIPVSLLATVVVFHWAGLSVNTMTLGGIAIAIGQLVDDSVVYVENILRRLAENRRSHSPRPVLVVIATASQEVRSGILYATIIVLLVFLPLFALPDEEGRLFTPLGVAFIVSITASLITSITLTPALCALLLPNMKSLEVSHDSRVVLRLKQWNQQAVSWAFDHPNALLLTTLGMVVAAAISVTTLPRSFLPPFNEGTLYIQILNRPGVSLAESVGVGQIAEHLVMQVPGVKSIARRTGRNENDEDADPVNSSEFPVQADFSHRSRAEIIADIRNRLSVLPVQLNVTQFLTSRMEVAAKGVRGAIVLKIFGDDLETLRTLAGSFRQKFSTIPGLVDLSFEQTDMVPQIRIRIDYTRAKLFGVTPAAVTRTLERLSNGRVVSQIIDQGRRFDVIMRLSDADRTSQSLADLRVETPTGHVPLSAFASVDAAEGPSQILRENAKRRIVVMTNTHGRDTAAIVAEMRRIIDATRIPEGYSTSLEGSFQQQEESQVIIAGLAMVSMIMVFLVLRNRYLSSRLALIIMGNVPLALICSVIALWLWGQDLSLASMIGFITVTGVCVRNGVLKISHFINLVLSEGEAFGRDMILRGCQERLTPVLMTALSAGLALIPLLFLSDHPGTEILHPVAVAIFGGLVSSTLLDMLTTPLLFARYGREPLERLVKQREQLTSPELF